MFLDRFCFVGRLPAWAGVPLSLVFMLVVGCGVLTLAYVAGSALNFLVEPNMYHGIGENIACGVLLSFFGVVVWFCVRASHYAWKDSKRRNTWFGKLPVLVAIPVFWILIIAVCAAIFVIFIGVGSGEIWVSQHVLGWTKVFPTNAEFISMAIAFGFASLFVVMAVFGFLMSAFGLWTVCQKKVLEKKTLDTASDSH